MYILYNLEYKNGDLHIVDLVVFPHIPIVSKKIKIQMYKEGLKSQYESILVVTSNDL